MPAVKNGEITEKEIDERVKRILVAKQQASIHTPINFEKNKLLTPYVKKLKKRLYQAAITIVRDTQRRLPLKNNKCKVVSFGPNPKPFVQALKKYRNLEHIPLSLAPTQKELEYFENLSKNEELIVSLHLPTGSGMIELKKKQIKSTAPVFVKFINNNKKNITLALFGNPYNLVHFNNVKTVLVGYENEPEAQKALAEVLLGIHEATGTVPINLKQTASSKLKKRALLAK